MANLQTPNNVVLFVHGLGGDQSTWGDFPNLLKNDESLVNYDIDIKFYRYPTRIFSLPLIGRPPNIQVLADGLKTFIENEVELNTRIHLVCHSLGGLVARQFLVSEFKSKRLGGRKIASLFLYATPCNGATLAAVGKLVSPFNWQVRQLAKNSELISTLNHDWDTFEMDSIVSTEYVVGGVDSVVDIQSAKFHWHGRNVSTVIDKGHIDIVKPKSLADLSYKILKRGIIRFGSQHPKEIWHPVSSSLAFSRELYYQGKLWESEDILLQLIRKGCRDSSVIRQYSKVLFAQKRIGEVGRFLTRLKSSELWGDPDVKCIEAELYIRTGRYGDALEVLSKVSKRSTRNLEYLSGTAYLFLSATDSLNLIFARKHFLKAIKNEPKSWWAITNLILTCQSLINKGLDQGGDIAIELPGLLKTAVTLLKDATTQHPQLFSARLYAIALFSFVDNFDAFCEAIKEDLRRTNRPELIYVFPESYYKRIEVLYGTGERYLLYKNAIDAWLVKVT